MTPLLVKVSYILVSYTFCKFLFVNVVFAMQNIEIHNTLHHLASVCKTMQHLLET